MTEVRCLYKWNENKAKQLESWVKAHNERYAVFLEDDPAIAVLNSPHPRIRCFSLSESSRSETLKKIAWEFLYLPFTYDANHPLLNELAAIQTEINYRAFDFADQGSQLLQNFKANLSAPTQFAKDLYGKFKNVPAIVCGGGPSLSSAESSLKRLQNESVIIGCGAGIEALLKMGVKPHFAAHVDTAPLHRFTTTDVPLFYQLRTSSAVVAKYKGPRFLVPGAGNFPLESWLQKQLGLEEVLDGGWTVGTFGVAIAAALGCNSITLAGLDFAALPGKLYAPGVKTTATSDGFLPMKNREGRDVLSRADWVLAAEWLDKFAQHHPDRQWGTISSRGLEIPSIPLVSIEQLQGFPYSVSLETSKINGELLWSQASIGLSRCFVLCQKILQEMEKIFPQHPLQHNASALLEHDLAEELAYKQVLDPLWAYWHHVIERHNTAGEFGSYLNRILFFQSICEKFHAV